MQDAPLSFARLAVEIHWQTCTKK